jgi:hypothetical protein
VRIEEIMAADAGEFSEWIKILPTENAAVLVAD